MNMTQRQWGEKYNCGRKVEHHVPLLVMVSIVLCIPIVFYTLVRLAGKIFIVICLYVLQFYPKNLPIEI